MTGEGPGAGAALAIGFLALLKGDALIQGITITGTLEATGQIGTTSHVAEKVKSAAHAGYRVLLVPRGQFYTPRANLVSLGVESKVLVYEVGTIDEAYKIMTGKKL
jgi:predicted S18 family serine protease